MTRVSNIRRWLPVLLLLLCALAQAAPLLTNGGRMVFLGDSITEQRLYSRYVMNFFALRYPGMTVTFRNAGWSGDTAPGGLNRLDRDVLSLHPTVVSICFGMNDGGYRAFEQSRYDNYLKNMTALVDKLKTAGVQVVLLTPGCVDPDKRANGAEYNATLTRYAAGVKELAAKENLPVFDIDALMLDVQTRAKAAIPGFTMIPDSVHPNPAGHVVMAYGLLKALGCDEPPSGLTIDSASATATPDRCTLQRLKVTPGEITFTRKDDALPVYFDNDAAATDKFLPFSTELNQYPFKVSGLEPGNWRLSVQGVDAGIFSAYALSLGVNLTTANGPWKELGEEVNLLDAQQEGLYYNRWRRLSLLGFPGDIQPEMQALQPNIQAVVKKMDDAIAQQESMRAAKVADRDWSWSLRLLPANLLLKAGGRMVFLGDSITEQRIYTRYVMNFFALRYPGMKVSFRNAGWSGDTAPGGLNRLQRDVLSLHPTVVSICFGMNDGGYQAFDQPRYDNYITNMIGLVKKLKAARVQVVLLTPGCVDPDKRQNGAEYNATLTRYAAGVKELAAQEQLPVFDIDALMLEVQARAKVDHPGFTMIPDSVHPNHAGHAVMAYGLLKALGCAGVASGLTIDAAGAKATTDHCRVKDLKITPTKITFTRKDDALPVYFDNDAAATDKYITFSPELNQYPLKVTGLPAGNWQLTVQGVDAGVFPAEALTAGVNLTTTNGPWKALGDEVNRLDTAQEDLYYTRWRAFSLLAIPGEAQPAMQTLLKNMDEMITKQETARAAKVADRTWSWSLSLVK